MLRWSVSVMPRMLRLGVVADCRASAGELAALPGAVAGAGLGPLWVTDRQPTGPMTPEQLATLTHSSAAASVALVRDEGFISWGTAEGAAPPVAALGLEIRPRVVVPSWPERRLEELLRGWVRAGGRLADLVVEVPVSIGRSRVEAAARSGPWFATLGDPAAHGLFGTLEDCQDQVAALSVTGITELRAVLPRADLVDVIAQLAAVVIGLAHAHGPGVARSAPPPPPESWGTGPSAR